MADRPELVREAYRLRHQVYCVENKYESGTAGFEIDEFDARSRHVVIRHQRTGHVVGAARLVLPLLSAIDRSFPMQRVCEPRLLRHLPLQRAGEISRFAISKQRRNFSGAAISLMRLALVQGVVRMSAEAGHTHWLALMEPSLLRLLRSNGFHFQPIGPMVEHHGVRQPVFADVDRLLRKMAQDYREVWDFITAGGRLWGDQGRRLAA